jgi:hypothetical protein
MFKITLGAATLTTAVALSAPASAQTAQALVDQVCTRAGTPLQQTSCASPRLRAQAEYFVPVVAQLMAHPNAAAPREFLDAGDREDARACGVGVAQVPPRPATENCLSTRMQSRFAQLQGWANAWANAPSQTATPAQQALADQIQRQNQAMLAAAYARGVANAGGYPASAPAQALPPSWVPATTVNPFNHDYLGVFAATGGHPDYSAPTPSVYVGPNSCSGVYGRGSFQMNCE